MRLFQIANDMLVIENICCFRAIDYWEQRAIQIEMAGGVEKTYKAIDLDDHPLALNDSKVQCVIVDEWMAKLASAIEGNK